MLDNIEKFAESLSGRIVGVNYFGQDYVLIELDTDDDVWVDVTDEENIPLFIHGEIRRNAGEEVLTADFLAYLEEVKHEEGRIVVRYSVEQLD